MGVPKAGIGQPEMIKPMFQQPPFAARTAEGLAVDGDGITSPSRAAIPASTSPMASCNAFGSIIQNTAEKVSCEAIAC